MRCGGLAKATTAIACQLSYSVHKLILFASAQTYKLIDEDDRNVVPLREVLEGILHLPHCGLCGGCRCSEVNASDKAKTLLSSSTRIAANYV